MYRKSIKLRIVIALVIIVSGGLIISESYRYKSSYDQATAELNQLCERIITRLAENLVLPLWEVDDNWTRKIINAEMRDRQVYAITIIGNGDMFLGRKRDANWEIIESKQEIDPTHYIVHKKNIMRDQAIIGSVEIFMTSKFMERRLKQNTIAEISITAALIILMIIFLVIMLNRIVIEPLYKLMDAVKAISQGKYEQDIDVSQKGEIGMLTSEFKFMQRNVLLREKQIKESQAQVHLLLDSTAEAIYGINTQGDCTFINRSCLNMLGYNDADELLGRNMHDIMHYRYPDGRDYPVEHCHIYQAFQNRKKVYIDDEVMWRKDGTSFAVEYWSHPIIQDGECLGAVVTFIDISKRLETQQALKESEQDLAITLNSIGDAVVATDAQGRVSKMNPVAEKLTGWSFKQAQNKLLKDIFPIIDASTRKSILNPVEKVLKTGETVYLSNHTTLIAKDGTERQIADSAAPIKDSNNNVMGMVLVFNDVTEQYQLREQARRSQQELHDREKEQRDMINFMVNAVISIDEDGIILSFNTAAESLFGYSFEEIKGINISHLMPEPDSSRHDGYLSNYLKTGKAKTIGFGREVQGLTKLNQIFSMRLLVAELPNGADGKRRFIGSCVDLTHEKSQEQQIRRTQKMNALGKLTGGIAHDYNNMLGVILGYSDLLKSKLTEQPKLAGYADHILHASKRGAKLTKKLLSFSRNDPTEATALDLNKILLEQQDLLQKTLTVSIKLEVDTADDLWLVRLDSSDLENAILNMSINAMHSINSAENTKRRAFTIRTSNQVLNNLDAFALGIKSGDYVRLSLTDTGVGMDEATKEKIFDPFFSTKGEGGTGLGLSQVFGFVNRAGGAIHVYSELGHGSQFALYFPRYRENDAETGDDDIVGKVNFSGSETILIVDDEEALREFCEELLSQEGYQIFSAEGGKKALEILEHEHVDLVLSDIIMPEMDGYQLAAIIQDKYPKMKIQLVSGFSDERHKEIIDDNLQESLLYKPYSSQKLLKTIRNLLDTDD